MKKIWLFSLALFFILTLGLTVQATQINRPIKPDSSSALNGGSLGEKINVAASEFLDERNPAVAVCGDYYLVAYERGGDIYGQRINMSGELVGEPIQIYSGTYNSSNPDVACLWPYIFDQYFVVVWDYDYDGDQEDYDVYAQVIYPDGSLFSTAIPVANRSSSREMKPTIACEVDSNYCLVVFEDWGEGYRNVYGQRLHLINFGLEPYGDLFDPGSDADDDIDPDLTWSMDRGEYLLVWSDWYAGSSGGHFRAVFSMIYEEEQGDGASEIKNGPYWLIDPSEPGHDTGQRFPVVAYNNLSGRSLVAFQENASGLNNVIGVLLEGYSQVGDPLVVAEEVYDRPAVAFSGGETGAVNAMDEFLIVTPELSEGEYRLEGAYVWKSHLTAANPLITPASSTNLFQEPAVTGSPQNGNYLVVWEEANSAGYDIYGQLYDNGEYHDIFLPLILR